MSPVAIRDRTKREIQEIVIDPGGRLETVIVSDHGRLEFRHHITATCDAEDAGGKVEVKTITKRRKAGKKERVTTVRDTFDILPGEEPKAIYIDREPEVDFRHIRRIER